MYNILFYIICLLFRSNVVSWDSDIVTSLEFSVVN